VAAELSNSAANTHRLVPMQRAVKTNIGEFPRNGRPMRATQARIGQPRTAGERGGSPQALQPCQGIDGPLPGHHRTAPSAPLATLGARAAAMKLLYSCDGITIEWRHAGTVWTAAS